MEILNDLYLPAMREALKPGPLMQLVMGENERRRKADEEWLASLTPHARKVELTRRRIALLESRFADALDFSSREEW